MEVLSGVSLPPGLLRTIRAIYARNTWHIKVNGQCFWGFKFTSGVRQGCPLSPVLFGTAADILLRRLCSSFPSAVVRVLVDVMAMVLPDVWRSAPGVLQVFCEFGTFSSMKLHIGKTVLIPLWGSGPLGVGPADCKVHAAGHYLETTAPRADV